MSKEQNVYIFERKELAILLVLLVLVALLAFTLGVKLGRELQTPPKEGAVAEQSSMAVEKVEAIAPPTMVAEPETPLVPPSPPAQPEKSESKLSALDRVDREMGLTQKKIEAPSEASPQSLSEVSHSAPASPSKGLGESPPVFTLQVGSYRTLAEAERQRDSISAKGFPAQVVQVNLPNKGTWYRVSVGAFDKREAALEYGKKLKESLPRVAYILQTL